MEAKVVATKDRTATISISGERDQDVATSLVLLNAQAILVLCIGDLTTTERTLLDPLTKSALQFLRLLLTDDLVTLRRLRSTSELSAIWATEHPLHSWILVVGHGSSSTLSFAVDGAVSPSRVGEILEATPPPNPVSVLSLACQTGYRGFAGELSEFDAVARVIAPYHSVHGAVASQFAQTFFTNLLLEGYTPRVAFRRAKEWTPDGTVFRCWENGRMQN